MPLLCVAAVCRPAHGQVAGEECPGPAVRGVGAGPVDVPLLAGPTSPDPEELAKVLSRMEAQEVRRRAAVRKIHAATGWAGGSTGLMVAALLLGGRGGHPEPGLAVTAVLGALVSMVLAHQGYLERRSAERELKDAARALEAMTSAGGFPDQGVRGPGPPPGSTLGDPGCPPRP